MASEKDSRVKGSICQRPGHERFDWVFGCAGFGKDHYMKIVVGQGSCGIASGAKKTEEELLRLVKDRKLKNLLRYIGKSTKANITDDLTDKLNDIVHKAKAKKGVGVRYMKSWEREKELREEGREEGRKEGRKEGREEERKNTEAERKRADTKRGSGSLRRSLQTSHKDTRKP